jgi:AMMECR1 domain-containing protein
MIARLARTVRSLGRSAFRPALPEVAPPAPIDRADQLALLRLARAAVARHLGVPLADGMPPASPSLLQRTDSVFVAFWVDGTMRGCRSASGESLLRNTLIATRRTLEDARLDRLGRDDVGRLRIEIDVLGPSGPFRARKLPHFEPAIEPGIHGIIAERDGQRAFFKSSVGITKNWDVEQLIPRLCEKGGWAPEAYRRRDVRFSRFRSTAFIETSGGDGTQQLLRANVPIGPADWSHDRIARAIEDGTEYLLRSQRSDGGFVYEYAPATAEYATGDNIVRQVATAWVLAALERRSGTKRHRAALTRALDFISAKTRRAAPHSSALVVADDPDVAELGTVAFGLLTVVTAGDDALRATAGRYADAILSLQQPDGRFHTHFPPATQPEAEDFYPGEAMLALMHLHMRDPDSRYPEALCRAFPYYREHFRRRRSTAFVAWQMAAYAQLFRLTRDRQYADFVFEMADAILSIQHVGPAVPYPDYVGGYRSLRVPGVSSATYNEGVLEAYDLARQTGDRERAARYQRAALLGALFTLRLQFTRENAYYIAHADRALGAFRASLADSTLRIDHTQHALNSLLKAERYFFQTGLHGETVSHDTPRATAAAGRCGWATQHNEGRKEDVNAREA